MRRAPRTGLLLLTVLALAGCAAIPTTGEVTEGRANPAAAQPYVIVPNPPGSGDDPEDIVRGFVQAQQGSTLEVAREFLTPQFAAKWRPSAGVLIHDDQWSLKADSTTDIELSLPMTGSLDAAGVYTPSVRKRSLDFQLAKVSGQWRINAAPDGVVLPRSLFQRNYSPSTLQFFSTDYARLVPDVRWFSNRPAQTAKTVVEALLAGRSAVLQGGVAASAFPAGSRVVAGPSLVGGTTALTIDVPSRPNAVALSRMAQQLEGSLGLTSAGMLQLTVDGRVVASPEPIQSALPDTRPAVIVGGRFGLLSTSGLSSENALTQRIGALHPTAVTLSSRAPAFAAVLGSAGVVAVQSATQKVVDARSGLAAPTVDQSGWIYSVPMDDPTALEAHDVRGRAAPLHAVLPDASVVSVEVSRDGTRLLALVRTESGSTEAMVFGIERDASGSPTALSSTAYPIETDAGPIKAATWLDDSTVAMLTVGSDGAQVVAQQPGSIAKALGSRLSSVNTIVGGATQDDLRVRLSTGEIWVYGRGGWAPEFTDPVDVQVLAVQR